MKLLEILVTSPVASAVGWTLLHSLWQGAIIAALLSAILMLTRSPRMRYGAALLALLAIICAFAFTLLHMLPENPQTTTALTARPRGAWIVTTAIGSPARWFPGLEPLAPWLAPFWMAGVLLCYLRHLAGLVSVRRLRKRGVCCAPALWQDAVARFSARLRITRPVVLLESCLAEVPMVIGALRPLILMPIGLLTGLPEEQIEAILLHELAHVRRHDYLVNVLQRLAEGLLFYHPAAWWISRVIRMERENCCDDIAVSIGGNAREYATALAALEHNRWPAREPAVAASGGNLVTRIRRLLYPKTSSGAWTPFAAAAVLVVTAGIALGGWQSPADTPLAKVVDDSPTIRYTKWLNEDVVYIIDAPERAAFLKLGTDEERDHFVEQFWARRDPTPGTAQNEFKVEHYRRIAYANQHFASGVAGWRTDRGHMYILWGPPDEIESHPASADTQYGNEVWMYRHLSGVGDFTYFTFIDKSGHGDYRLAPGNAH
jgi:GWxTD domain-containing protein